ncbi:MAG: YraN family protein [Burkholderiales bacterium]|nr:YraN family protein [Burkholderiales bacterium]
MNWWQGLKLPKLARPRADTQALGQAGEDAALAYLQQRGLVLLERNFRCKAGEIDLIMRDGAQLIFVEVRLRASAKFGGASASVTPAKQRRLLLTAQYYLQRHSPLPRCRFDLIAIEAGQIFWLQDIIAAAD